MYDDDEDDNFVGDDDKADDISTLFTFDYIFVQGIRCEGGEIAQIFNAERS